MRCRIGERVLSTERVLKRMRCNFYEDLPFQGDKVGILIILHPMLDVGDIAVLGRRVQSARTRRADAESAKGLGIVRSPVVVVCLNENIAISIGSPDVTDCGYVRKRILRHCLIFARTYVSGLHVHQAQVCVWKVAFI